MHGIHENGICDLEVQSHYSVCKFQNNFTRTTFEV